MRRLTPLKILIAPLITLLISCNNDHNPNIGKLNTDSGQGGASKPGSGNDNSKKLLVPGYLGQVRALFQVKCGSCHKEGGPIPNWSDYPTAKAKAQRILARAVLANDMPPGAPLSKEEKELLGKWIQGGAPENPIYGSEDTLPPNQPPVQEPSPLPPSQPPVPQPPPSPVEPPVAQPPEELLPIPEGTPITYESVIRPLIFEKKCQMCHNAEMEKDNPKMKDLMVYAKVKPDLELIRQRIFVETDPVLKMPVGFDLTKDELRVLKLWLDAGGPEKVIPVTYDQVKAKVFKKYCALCHNSGSEPMAPNWFIESRAVEKKEQLYYRVFVKKDMPQGGGAPAEDLEILKRWLQTLK